jgi:hypothetical protein
MDLEKARTEESQRGEMTSFRIVKPIQFAYQTSPSAGAAARPFGPESEGLRLERQLHTLTGTRSEWFRFRDASGLHVCQVDGLLPAGPFLVLFECKLRWHSYVRGQIFRLLKPVVEAAYPGRQVCPVVVTRSTSGAPQKLFADLLPFLAPDKIVRWELSP